MRPTLPGLERLDRVGDGEIGLAGAGRPKRQGQVMAADRRHEGALRFAFGRTVRT